LLICFTYLLHHIEDCTRKACNQGSQQNTWDKGLRILMLNVNNDDHVSQKKTWHPIVALMTSRNI